MRACMQCGREAAEDARFCAGCGAVLNVEPAREERKVVAVLFADLVGSTARAETLDPEDVRAILAPFYARLRSELERFGGTVEKFIGDAVMAVFGAPVAHEDDPERAVRAALAIRDWALEEETIQVRIAVHTGEALVALGARLLEGEGMVAGDVVNTAARLQSAAPVNAILVGEQTFRATERAIEYREAEPVSAKGKTEPIRVWEAVQARSRFGVDLAAPSGSPLVGREEELNMLVAALSRARNDRAPQLVTLVGVPGIGKSRLLGELFAAIEQADVLTTWRQGRSLSYGEGVSYWALGEMVKAQAGILETDSPEEAGRKLADAVGRLLPEETEARWVESHLRPLAGMAAEDLAGDRRGEAFAAWRRFFEALAEDRPLVLVFEDVHWADDGLLDFVDHLVDWLTDVPVLLVATARPELLARRPAWGGGKANATTVSLSPLSDVETARLVHGLLEKSVLPAEVQSALLERAGGNPLYAEEFVRMVAERGHERTELPEAVQGIIAARLDGLDSEDKGLLQDAAVVGKVFWSGALVAIGGRERFAVEERLHALERRELVRRERRTSVAGESEYAFRHVLVRDVAYSAIPRAARAERHRAAAEWIESLGRPDDHADLLAYHYLAALDLASAAGVDIGVLPDAAGGALRRAGDRAFGLNAFVNASRFYGEALALGEQDGERPVLLLRLGAALHLAGDERRIAVLEEARSALFATGDSERAAEASVFLAEAWWHRGENERARAHLERAQELVRGRGDTPAAARVLAEAARYAMIAGDGDEALRAGREALRMAEELGIADLVPHALISIGGARAYWGDPGGVEDLERAIETAVRTNNPDAARAYNNLGSCLADQGELVRAGELWLEGLAVAERLGNATIARWLRGNLLWRMSSDGRWDECLAAADDFIAECEAGSPHYMEFSAHLRRAEILLARDDETGAQAAAARAVELARKAKDPQALGHALAGEIQVALEQGRLDDARRVAREWLSSAREGAHTNGITTVAVAADRLGLADELQALLGQLPEDQWTSLTTEILAAKFARAADLVANRGTPALEAELRLLAARHLVNGARRAEADEQLRPAISFFRSVGATRYLRQAESMLAATA